MKRTYTIIHEAGLHARPASLLVQEATKFTNDIFIEFESKRLTLKSIIAVLSLGVSKGRSIVIDVEGENAEEVFTALEKVLNTNNLI